MGTGLSALGRPREGLDLAYYAKSRFPISEFVEDEIDKLAAKSGEMALFTVEEHWKGVTLYVAFGEKSIQPPIYIGNREPLHNTAVGKAILAHKSAEEREAFLESEGLQPVTEQSDGRYSAPERTGRDDRAEREHHRDQLHVDLAPSRSAAPIGRFGPSPLRSLQWLPIDVSKRTLVRSDHWMANDSTGHALPRPACSIVVNGYRSSQWYLGYRTRVAKVDTR